MKNNIVYKYKPVAFPVSVIIIVIAITFIGGNALWQRIGDVRAEISQLVESNRVLDERLNTLQGIPVEINESIQLSTVALPENSPTLLAAISIRQLAENNELLVENLEADTRSSSRDEDQILKESTIELLISGNDDDVLQFMEDIQSMTPVVTMEGVEMQRRRGDEQLSLNLELAVFASDFPETLPSINEPIENLSQNHLDVLEQIQAFSRPQISTFSEIETNEDREDPFNLEITQVNQSETEEQNQ